MYCLADNEFQRRDCLHGPRRENSIDGRRDQLRAQPASAAAGAPAMSQEELGQRSPRCTGPRSGMLERGTRLARDRHADQARWRARGLAGRAARGHRLDARQQPPSGSFSISERTRSGERRDGLRRRAGSSRRPGRRRRPRSARRRRPSRSGARARRPRRPGGGRARRRERTRIATSASASGSWARKRRPASSCGTTSRRPPVSATMQGQPEAIASSATRPNGS